MLRVGSDVVLCRKYFVMVFFVLQPSHKYLITSFLLAHECPHLVLIIGASAQECLQFIRKQCSARRLLISLNLVPSNSTSVVFNFLLNFFGRISRIFLSKSFLVLKSSAYHQPLLSTKHFDIAYLGDGFGITSSNGQSLPWLVTRNKKLDRLLSDPISAGLVSFESSVLSSDHYPDSYVDLALARQLRSVLLESAPDIVSSKELIMLQDCSEVIYCNRLGNLRLSAHLEHVFWRDYISSHCNITSDGFVLIVPHPAVRCNHHYAQSLSNELKHSLPGLRFVVLGSSSSCSPLAGLSCSAEELASVFVRFHSMFHREVIFHVFQSGVFSLYSIFPELQISFGFGKSLIDEYFWTDPAFLQAQFESYVSQKFLENRLA